MRMVELFLQAWSEVPICFLDTETTGPVPGIDRAVQVGLVRFEGGKVVGEFEAVVNPGRPISPEATAIHGLSDEDVAGAITVEELFTVDVVRDLLRGAQPGAYNASFDRAMVPPITDDHQWPWLDALPLVREVDRFARGKGRHRLEVACQRHGIPLEGAHTALADARAAGLLFHKLCDRLHAPHVALGDVLRTQRLAEVEQWADFQGWLAKQPPQAPLPGV